MLKVTNNKTKKIKVEIQSIKSKVVDLFIITFLTLSQKV